jgi:hypothetical protein
VIRLATRVTRYAEQVRSDPGTKNAMAAQAKLFDEEGAMRCKAKVARRRRSGELKFLGGAAAWLQPSGPVEEGVGTTLPRGAELDPTYLI